MKRLALFACAAASVCGAALTSPPANADPPRPARIGLGDLTFNYRPTSWRIVAANGALEATCVQDDCRGATIDVTRRDGEDGCTVAAMTAAAAAAFPEGERAYANLVRAGRFGLVLAERHAGPHLSSPAFVYGCLNWNGNDYRFAMRHATIGEQAWIGGALHYLVSQAEAETPPDITVRIGALNFSISAEQWAVASYVEGQSARLKCRVPTCHRPDEMVALSVDAQPTDADAIEPDTFDQFDDRVTEIPRTVPDGADFTVTTRHPGCRNLVPPQVSAVAIINGHAHHVATTGPFGCRTTAWGIPDNAFEDLLKRARIVQ